LGGIEDDVTRPARADLGLMDLTDTAGVHGPSADDLVVCYRATVAEVHRYLSKLTAGDRALTEDLTQETYAAMVASTRGRWLPEPPLPWLMVTARNAFLQRLRSSRREERRWDRAGWTARDRGPADDPVVRTVTTADEAHRLLRRLPDDQRAVLVFRHVDDLPVGEIARLLGRSVRATESLLARATANVRRDALQEEGNDA
jgi:RNA polymerase sigma-70 factor (ECF subfamily)